MGNCCLAQDVRHSGNPLASINHPNHVAHVSGAIGSKRSAVVSMEQDTAAKQKSAPPIFQRKTFGWRPIPSHRMDTVWYMQTLLRIEGAEVECSNGQNVIGYKPALQRMFPPSELAGKPPEVFKKN
mmetsp:Transcript_50740/g.135293  ORF Transcript_50740/g.135293 Transcript_50740/m.135293 type:complete len:126 (-) Transcript_50740:111-488(-)